MIEPGHPGLSVSRQCALLSISRSSFYYTPKGESEMNLALVLMNSSGCAMRRPLRHKVRTRSGPAKPGCHGAHLAWRISNTLEADFCVEALNEAIHTFGAPEIQGSQFTSFVASADGRAHLDGEVDNSAFGKTPGR